MIGVVCLLYRQQVMLTAAVCRSDKAHLRRVCTCLCAEGHHHGQKQLLRQSRLKMLLHIHGLASAGGTNKQTVMVMAGKAVQQVGVPQSVHCRHSGLHGIQSV